MLDGCWFLKEKKPKWPHHQFCHCVLEDIPYNEVLTLSSCKCPYEKFDPYLFDPDNFYKHGKSAMLESWGYSILDSTYLKGEIEKQALEKYKNGDGMVSFITGWMVKPNGLIQLNTPFGGK